MFSFLRGYKTKSEPSTEIVRRDIQLPGGQQKLAFILDNVYSKEECEEYIRLTEEKGYQDAEVNLGGRQVLAKEIRNSSRCIWDSYEESAKLFERIKPYLPETWEGHKLLGLNERLRFLRYDPGGYFKPHFDGYYRRDNGEMSFITVHMYLNEGYKGGCTTFIDPTSDYDDSKNKKVKNVPAVIKTGSVLIFQHRILHEGSTLLKGRKYTVRTYVMYSAERV